MINIVFEKDKLIKSPLNYVGGKFKLLPQILPLIPDNINTFVDLFCGGCNIGVNIKANKIVCNDSIKQIIDLYNYLLQYTEKEIFEAILSLINKYKLSDSTINSYEDYGCNSSDGLGKHNKEAYLSLRKSYNTYPDNKFLKSIMFYTLACYSFSNNIRFNSKQEFNMPFGKRDFNKSIRQNLSNFIKRIKEINISFINSDFKDFSLDSLNQNDFIYLDPPYLITTANYNENGGWTEKHELDLLNLLDKLNNKSIRFALSNVLEHKGKSNDILKEWSDKYTVHNLTYNYGNANYNTKDKSKNSTKEVLIVNY